MTVLPAFSGGTPRHFPPVGGVGTATIYTDPQDYLYTSSTPIDSAIGTYFTVNVRIANATHVASWQAELSYNAAYLSTVAANVSYSADMIFAPGLYPPILPSIGVENATHNYVLMTATRFGAVENDTGAWPASKGLMKVTFKIIADPPAGLGNKLWCSLRFEHTPTAVFGTWAADTNLFDNDLYLIDGYYENAYVAPGASYLEITPATVTMGAIEGDRIVGTDRAFFDVDILIHSVNSLDELFFIQLNISYDPTLLTCYDIEMGPFMVSDPDWVPHGYTDNSTITDYAHGYATWWIMINPNDTGYWDNTEWPSGVGLLATAHFEVTGQNPDDPDGVAPASISDSPLNLQGVFGQFFLGHPNLPDPPYLPYGDPVNGVAHIYDYYWRLPTAIKTHTPMNPLVDQVTTFDGSTSYGWRNVNGSLVLDYAYIADYEWYFGDDPAADPEYGPVVTHAYAAMGTYNVTLTVYDLDGLTDTVWQELIVLFGRLIDVYIGTGTGPYPAPYGGQGPNNVADMFEPQKTVCVYANVTYNGDAVQSKLVTFIILSPHGLHDFSRTAITDENGQAYIEFGLPWPCVDPVNEIFGIWNITVKVDIRSVVVEDIVPFKVWWLIEVTSVELKTTDFVVKNTTACFEVHFRTYRMQPIDGVIEITLYDDLNVPFGSIRLEVESIGWGNYTWCVFKEYNITFCVDIPKWAFVGIGTAYVNAFHYDITNPYHMGSPYCPEIATEFLIYAKAPE